MIPEYLVSFPCALGWEAVTFTSQEEAEAFYYIKAPKVEEISLIMKDEKGPFVLQQKGKK